MDTHGAHTAEKESWDDFFEFQLGSSARPPIPITGAEVEPAPEPGPSSPTLARIPAVVENWDDDFAEDDEHADFEPPEEEGLAGPNTSVSVSVSSVGYGGLVSPRSFRSLRAVGVVGEFDEGSSDDEESWDEEDEEEEESWDEDDEEAQEHAPLAPPLIEVPVHTPAEDVDASLSLASTLALSLPPPSSSPALQQPPPETPPPASLPAPVPSTSASTPAFIPSPDSSLATSETSHPDDASLTPISSSTLPLPSGPSLKQHVPPSHEPAHLAVQHGDEFGLKTRKSADDEEEHGEMEDEDATITARSRQRRPGTRHTRGHSGSGSASASGCSLPVPPVPPIPALSNSIPSISSTPTFTPPPPAVSLAAVTPVPSQLTAGVGGGVDEEEDRGEGPSTRRVPVFSPPATAVIPPSASTSTVAVGSSASSAVTDGKSQTATKMKRPNTADRLGSRRGAFDVGDGRVGGGEVKVGGNGGLLRRIGDGVSRWASSSGSSNGNGSGSGHNGSGTSDARKRGRGRANTVTGASAVEVRPGAQAQAQIPARTEASHARPAPVQASGAIPRPSMSSHARPSMSSARPSAATSSGRPSTATSTSSVRPSTSSSTSSSSPSSRPFARPRPTAASPAGQNQNQNQSQRNSIVSLLSIYTHRSRTSSISVSRSTSGSSRRTSGLSAGASTDRERNEGADGGGGVEQGDEAPPRTSISSWTQRLFSGNDARARQSVDELRARQSVDLSSGSGSNQRQRQSLDVRPAFREASAAATPAGNETETKGVLGFFGARRKRSNTVTAVPLSSSAARPDGGEGKEDGKEEEVYANKKASKSQRSLQVLLGRKSSVLARRGSRKGKDGGVQDVQPKLRGEEGTEGVRKAEVETKPESVFSPPPPASAAEVVLEPTTPLAPRGVKRRIPSGRASLPLIVQVPSVFEAEARPGGELASTLAPERDRPLAHRPTQSQSSSRSTSNSNSLSSIGELRIPSRISQAQVSIRRDLGLVKEFAGKVAELKDLQGSYLKMIESVQGMIDTDAGQTLTTLPVKPSPSRPRSNTSPALSRPPSRSPLAALFQGPDQSSNPTSENTSPSPVTPATPSTPTPTSTMVYSSTDLAQRMADITARYDSWWECAELLIELGNTPPSMPTPVSSVRLVPPTLTIAPAPPPSPAPPPPTPTATVTPKSRGDTLGAISTVTSAAPSSSNHAESTLKPSRGRANTFAGNMPVSRLRSASTSTASIPHAAPDRLLSPSSSGASAAPSHTWRATTGRHDLSQRQLVLLRQMLGVDQRQQQQPSPKGPIKTVNNVHDDAEGLHESDGESDMEDATWRWGHANTVQLPSPAEEKEAYFGVAGRKKKQHSRPWSRPYHQDITQSEQELVVYVTPAPAPEPPETKKSKGMNAIRDMLRTLKRAHPPTPTASSFPRTSVDALSSLTPAPRMSVESPNGRDSLAPNKHAIRRAASLLPLSSATPSARVSSSSSTVSRASKIDPTLAFAMTPDNIKPLLDNAREVSARLGACVADVQALLASAGVPDAVPIAAG